MIHVEKKMMTIVSSSSLIWLAKRDFIIIVIIITAQEHFIVSLRSLCSWCCRTLCVSGIEWKWSEVVWIYFFIFIFCCRITQGKPWMDLENPVEYEMLWAVKGHCCHSAPLTLFHNGFSVLLFGFPFLQYLMQILMVWLILELFSLAKKKHY